MAALLVGAWALSPSARAATCQVTPEEMARHAAIAVAAYASMDDAGFASASQQMAEDPACLTAPPSAAQAALVHEVRALAAFVSGDLASARASLRAMHEADPSLRLSADLAPAGSPLDAIDRVALNSPASARVVGRVMEPCHLTVDGVAAHDLPRDNPSLVVIQDASGAVAWGGLLPPDPAVLTLCPSPEPVTRVALPEPRRRAQVGLEIAAGSSAGLAALLWTGALYDLARIHGLRRDLGDGVSAPDLGLHSDEDVRTRLNRADGLALAAQLSTEMALTFGVFAVGVRLRW